MSSKKYDEWADLCAELREFEGYKSKPKPKRKALKKRNIRSRQFCKQVFFAIETAFICDCDDEAFDQLYLDDVYEDKGQSRVIAQFKLKKELTVEKINDLYESLNATKALLRLSIARIINRKKVPELLIQIV